jgi:hypothetical protein
MSQCTASTPTTAYVGTRTIKLAAAPCPNCQHVFRAVDVELIGDGEVRLVCPGCHIDILLIEKR